MSRYDSGQVITRAQYDAVLFDLDGVITDTASLHAACWKQTFDEYLRKRAAQGGGELRCSIPPRTTGFMWTASRAPTASATSSGRAASNSRKDRRTTHPRPKP